MDAALIVGHGSLRPGSGAAMIRLAARVREAGAAPLVAAAFLNYSRPSLADAVARLVARGATHIHVQPYFLTPGKFVLVDLPRQIAALRAAYPALGFALAAPFGDHPALAELARLRAAAVAPEWGAAPPASAALLLMAHGSPEPSANQPIELIAERLRQATGAAVLLAYLSLNQPLLGPAIDQLVAQGIGRICAVPYFLQLGGHVAEDLPQAIGAARQRHPRAQILLAEHLGYHPLLAQVIVDRLQNSLLRV